MAAEPKTLQEAIVYFDDPQNCLDYMVARRWPKGVTCPTCGNTKVKFQPKHYRWQCSTKHPRRQFTAKVGTIYEDSPIGLDKWLTATWMITNCKNGNSSWELHRTLGVTQKTAWFMGHRIRLAMQDMAGGKLGGEVEIDETFIGGKARNMHKEKRERVITGTGGKDKTVVMGMMERGGNVRAMVVDTRRKKELQSQVREHVEAGAAIFTDELKSYDGLENSFQHQVINHAVEYVNGNVHTNAMENFWSLLKRGLHGTYVSVEPFHLFRYIDEQAFRFNNRKGMDDADRFDAVVKQIVGKRLTYAELTGKLDPSATQAIN
ncbi:MAG TPA: IS1595 family transposase [Bryobacteraceae bacterium]|nr:IS1595 family transposase [Bryobacteraceae bacterium]